MEREDGVSVLYVRAQTVELHRGENNSGLGKRYRKLEKSLCSMKGAGIGGSPMFWSYNGEEMPIVYTVTCCSQAAGLLQGLDRERKSLAAWKSHGLLKFSCGWKVARTRVADSRGGKANP